MNNGCTLSTSRKYSIHIIVLTLMAMRFLQRHKVYINKNQHILYNNLFTEIIKKEKYYYTKIISSILFTQNL